MKNIEKLATEIMKEAIDQTVKNKLKCSYYLPMPIENSRTKLNFILFHVVL